MFPTQQEVESSFAAQESSWSLFQVTCFPQSETVLLSSAKLHLDPGHSIMQLSPTFLAPETRFMEDNFSKDDAVGVGMVSGWFKCIAFILHFISVVITSAPPQALDYGGRGSLV